VRRRNVATSRPHVRPWPAAKGWASILLSMLVAGLSAQTPASGGAPPDLPDGIGAEVVRARCMSCHGSDLITSQKLTEAGWGREIDKMVRWGATVSDADRPALLAYLTTNFTPVPAASHSRAAEGEAVFKRACLTCHGADLTEQQRLSATGWTREVEKMMRWGAVVNEVEKAALVDFLATRYPMR
jgi:mono/diheme cytochrome c family protein